MSLKFFNKKISANQIVAHLLYWLVFVLFFTMIWGTYDNNYFRNLMIQILSLPSRLILVYVILSYLFPVFLLKKAYLKFVFFYVMVLIGVTVFIQRPIFLYLIRPLYLQSFENSGFFAITEIMNTLLDVNMAAIIPFGYVLVRSWQKENKKALALEKIQSENPNEDGFIYLKVEKSLLKVFIKDIIFIESLKNYIKLKTLEKEIIAYKSMASIQESLPKSKFLRVHRSFIVGIDFIDSFSPSKLTLNGISIPVGRKYKDEVKEILGYF